jgi:homoserine O-acetyltransferase/O-succinyltransferase
VEEKREAPTMARADEVLDTYVDKGLKTMDANNVLFALEASKDYDPAPKLGPAR